MKHFTAAALLAILLSACTHITPHAQTTPPPDPLAAGWIEEHPAIKFDLPPNTTGRHTESAGLQHFFILDSDPSTFPGRDSGCRAEARVYNDYTTGLHQFSADLLVEPGSDNVSLFQIFGNNGRATSCMLWASHNGSLSHYGNEILARNIFNTWIHLNVIHNADTGAIDVYINGEHRGTFHDGGTHNHYFKFGVYHQRNMSPRAGVFFKNIRYYIKPAQTQPGR